MGSRGNHDEFHLPMFTCSGLRHRLKECTRVRDLVTVFGVLLPMCEDGEETRRWVRAAQQSWYHLTRGEGGRGRGENVAH